MTQQRIYGFTRTANDTNDVPLYIQKIDNAFRRFDDKYKLCSKETRFSFDSLDKRFDKIDRQFDQIDRHLDSIRENVTSINRYLDFFFKFFISTIVILFFYILMHSH